MARKTRVDSEVNFPPTCNSSPPRICAASLPHANPAFCRIAGYQVDELVGHPQPGSPLDMPKGRLRRPLGSPQEGNPGGSGENRCKGWPYYWADAYVTPIYERQDKRLPVGALQARSPAQGLPPRPPTGPAPRPSTGTLPAPRCPFPGRACSAPLLALLVWAALTQGPLTTALLMLAAPAAHRGRLLARRLIALPSISQAAGQQCDSLTRLVYSGDAPGAIADFHLKMLQARIRTVLGRVDDATHPLQALATDLGLLHRAFLDINEQDAQTQQMAAAMTRWPAPPTRLPANIQDTNGQVTEARSSCQTRWNSWIRPSSR